MRLQEIGYEIRRARIGRGLTQATLAKTAGLSRVTLNQLETGVFPDLGAKKLQALLEALDLTLAIQPAKRARPSDYVRVAATTASVSFKQPLGEDELILALLTGKVPPGKRPHFRLLFDEAAPSLMRGLIAEVSRWSKPGRVEKNLRKLAHDIGTTERIEEWLKIV
jgi:transcriptional regulator with XRE-family HTH domain